MIYHRDHHHDHNHGHLQQIIFNTDDDYYFGHDGDDVKHEFNDSTSLVIIMIMIMMQMITAV